MTPAEELARPPLFESGGIDLEFLRADGTLENRLFAPGLEYSDHFVRAQKVVSVSNWAIKMLTGRLSFAGSRIRFATNIVEDPYCDRFIVSPESVLTILETNGKWSDRRRAQGQVLFSESSIAGDGSLGEQSPQMELSDEEVLLRALTPLILHRAMFSVATDPYAKLLDLDRKVTNFKAFAMDWEASPNLEEK